MTPLQPRLKAEKAEFIKYESMLPQSAAAAPVALTGDLLKQEQQDAAAVAGHLNLPLSRIQDWTAKHKRTWLKCMLSKHINWHAMGPSQRLATAQQLDTINGLLHSNANATLDNLIGLVESILACHVIGQILRNELSVWRLAAKSEPLSTVRPVPASSSSCGNSSRSSSSSCGSSSSGSCGRRVSGEGDLLWEHILRMLERGDSAVRWIQPELGRFQFVNSGSAARSWGGTKRNENMSFEKMSRSIRQYYRPRSGVMIKVPNKGRLQYQFNVGHPQVVRFLKENFPNSACLASKRLQ